MYLSFSVWKLVSPYHISSKLNVLLATQETLSSRSINNQIQMAAELHHDMHLIDHRKEVNEFDESKTGVKGLLDSGITTIPRIFIHPPENELTSVGGGCGSEIPVVDLSGLYLDQQSRAQIIDQITEAASTWGFFQVINHGIPQTKMEETLTAVRSFHESSNEMKRKYYGRSQNVCFMSNSDLFLSQAASWRDTLKVVLSPTPPEIDEIPAICRKEVTVWGQQATTVGEKLFEVMLEGLGVAPRRLKELSWLGSRILLAQYYPHCPQPDLTVGIVPHTDQSILTVLLQDQLGGLQVRNGEDWIDINPIEGALTINVGDFLQIISNDKYKSAEHRVVANRHGNPRISIPVFFHPAGKKEEEDTYYYGPLPELVSSEKPPLYQNFTMSDYWKHAQSKSLCRKSLIDRFKIVRE